VQLHGIKKKGEKKRRLKFRHVRRFWQKKLRHIMGEVTGWNITYGLRKGGGKGVAAGRRSTYPGPKSTMTGRATGPDRGEDTEVAIVRREGKASRRKRIIRGDMGAKASRSKKLDRRKRQQKKSEKSEGRSTRGEKIGGNIASPLRSTWEQGGEKKRAHRARRGKKKGRKR